MDIGSLAAALVATRVAQMQLAAAARIAKMQSDNSDAVAKLVDAADQNAGRLSAAAAGLGQAVDISA
jgi:hypothetical protein